MPDRPPYLPSGEGSDELPDDAAPSSLWFLREPDALVRRLVVRTLLEPPPGMRRLRPRWLKR
jgi:hypothetical protein